jgi:hypothetical protein
VLSLEYGIDVPMRRPVNDFGETGYPQTPTRPKVRVARKLNPPVRVRSDAGGNSYTQDGLLYVYRNEDVKEGDKFSLPEGDFIVYGPPENDQLNPLDGNDFGVKRYHIERG